VQARKYRAHERGAAKIISNVDNINNSDDLDVSGFVQSSCAALAGA
jgi:hypothetical protein